MRSRRGAAEIAHSQTTPQAPWHTVRISEPGRPHVGAGCYQHRAAAQSELCFNVSGRVVRTAGRTSFEFRTAVTKPAYERGTSDWCGESLAALGEAGAEKQVEVTGLEPTTSTMRMRFDQYLQ